MTLFLTAPSSVERGIPVIDVLLVIPATTMLPNSSNRTTAGRVFTSFVSVNWTLAKMTSPNLCTFPVLVRRVVPEFFHFWLLDAVEEGVVCFFSFKIRLYHVGNELVVGLSGVIFDFFEFGEQGFFELDGSHFCHIMSYVLIIY